MYSRHPRAADGLVIATDSCGTLARTGDRRTLELGVDEGRVLRACDGLTPVDHLAEKAGVRLSLTDISKLLLLLADYGLIESQDRPPVTLPARRSLWSRITRVYVFRFRTHNLSRHRRIAKAYVGALTVAIVTASVFIGYALAHRRQEIIPFFLSQNYLHWTTVPYYVLAVVLIGCLHESSHGASLIAFGGTVFECGLQLYYFSPAWYVDVTGISRLKERWKRILIWSLGVLSQTVIMAIGLFLQFFTRSGSDAGWARFLSVLNITNLGMMVFNLTFMIKLDGYYLLSEWLDLSSLRERAQGYVVRVFRGSGATDTTAPSVLGVIGVVSFVYIPILILGIVAAASRRFTWIDLGLVQYIVLGLVGVGFLVVTARMIRLRRQRRRAVNASAS